VSDVVVRHASPHDNVLLAELGAETFRDAFAPDNTPEDMELYIRRSFSPDIQAAEIADPYSRFLIAEADGFPVGYVRLRKGAPPAPIELERPIEINRIYARTSWIGRKVGATLMTACLSEAAATARATIWLAVWEKNVRAIGFYRKWQFVDVGSQPFLLGNDVQNDLIMVRPV
jgi:ribosomal protein S18 acetylase RimI-like enzyme